MRWSLSVRGSDSKLELAGAAGDGALERIAELAGELLANPVIEEFSIHPA